MTGVEVGDATAAMVAGLVVPADGEAVDCSLLWGQEVMVVVEKAKEMKGMAERGEWSGVLAEAVVAAAREEAIPGG